MRFCRLLTLTALLLLTAMANSQNLATIPYSGSVTLTLPPGCVLTGTVVTCPPPVPPVPPGPARTKLVPSGGNDDQIVWGAAAKGPIELCCAGQTFNLPPMTLPANADVYCDPGVTLKATSTGYSTASIMIDVTAPGVKLSGACSLTMPDAYAKNVLNKDRSTNQYNHCLAFTEGTSNSSVIGWSFDKCGGDAIYLNTASNIIIQRTTITNPIRNGISPTGHLAHVLIDSNDISQVHNANAGIEDAIDVEPNNPTDFITDLTISNNKLHDTAGSALCLQMYKANSSTPFTVSVINNAAANTHLPPVGGYGAFDPSNFPSPMNGKVIGSGNTVNGVAVIFP